MSKDLAVIFSRIILIEFLLKGKGHHTFLDVSLSVLAALEKT
jgi:hypothetical protein